ncbi:ureidoglycolate lyase [Actimicrobium sp. CCI2.3]|uniref:ureidoglycolate lyase n=1 Tax=Actimicrobium sp. CCI2.3 TaxID=3048616 RepID=UPI002AB44D57|nr:ureidoglycolate lyase [Actimicrobium sp. CCI2.3]MDY7573044.1 ureidoglycolate lyase [Actimicrobium sp. CCI2.3]MEB0020842.1 ureidoglycolate lyase [Actimicrobium sp. CCI2.3]
MRHIECISVTTKNFVRFGLVIDPDSCAPELINDGTTERYPELACFDSDSQAGGPVIGIYIAKARHFPLEITKLECHQQASQVFIPMGMHRFIIIVTTGRDNPEWENITAFITSPGQGISLHKGTWHHGLIALNDADRFAVIEGRHFREDTQEHSAPQKLVLDAPDQAKITR